MLEELESEVCAELREEARVSVEQFLQVRGGLKTLTEGDLQTVWVTHFWVFFFPGIGV